MNKYKSISKQLREERIKAKMCLNKVAYDNNNLAYQKGQKSYKCQHCGKWHRSGKMAKFIAEIKKYGN